MLQKLFGLLRRQRDCNRGSMAVEFALAVPALAMLVLGVADFGALMNTSASLRGAARAGAEYAEANWNNLLVSDPTTGAEQQVCGFLGLTLSGGSCSPVTPTVTPVCTCTDGTWITGNDCPPDSSDPTPCNSVSNGDKRVLVSVTVTATQNFHPMFSWALFSWAFPWSTLSAATTVRTQ
jgi:TadE-like protein